MTTNAELNVRFSMTRQLNIIWLLVDSVRSYATDVDDRGKLPVMERFGEQSIEFLNVVTSAPSTIMAISAMMSSLPSYMIARNYDDFIFDNQYFVCLKDILEQHGYFTMAFFRHPHPREKFQNLLNPVPREYWQPHLKHHDIWTNNDLRAVINNTLKAGIPRPAFLFCHFTARKDPHTSTIVENTLQDFRDAGFTDDNTVYILCSDHGYPDPARGYTPEGLKRQGLTHDLILTDDNIKIPLYFRFPNCVPNKIKTTVSSLDIAPTILDLVEVHPKENAATSFQGTSLLPLMKGETQKRTGSAFVRSDARLMYQTGRVTAIRNEQFKYLKYHDRPITQNEEFYDLANDPLEGENIVASSEPRIQAALTEFRAEFERQEQEAVRLQVNYTLSRFREQSKTRRSLMVDPNDVIILVEPQTAKYGEMIVEVLHKAWPQTNIDVLSHQTDPVSNDRIREQYAFTEDNITNTYRFVGAPPSHRYDVRLVFTINPSNLKSKALMQLAKRVHAKHAITVDCNMNVYRQHRFLYYWLAFRSRFKTLLREPMSAKLLLKMIKTTVRKRLGTA